MDIAHGDYSVTVEGNIISVVISWAFNKSGIRACINEIYRQVNSLKNTEFYLLMNHANFQGATPCAFDELNKFYRWLGQHNVAGIAFIFTSPVLLEIYESRVNFVKHLKVEMFSNQSSANNWLDVQMAKPCKEMFIHSD